MMPSIYLRAAMLLMLFTHTSTAVAQSFRGEPQMLLHVETSEGILKCGLTGTTKAVEYLVRLARDGRLVGTSFCRVVPDYFVQGGCKSDEDDSKDRVKLESKGQKLKHAIFTFNPIPNKCPTYIVC